jgi:hypothetical protein
VRKRQFQQVKVMKSISEQLLYAIQQSGAVALSAANYRWDCVRG